MSDPSSDLLARLSSAVERLSGQAHAPAPPPQPAAAPWPAMPQAAYPPQHGGYPQMGLASGGPLPFMPLPKPIGVSVPVTVPLPDGRELSVRVEFGPEAAENLAATAAAAAQLFGQYLQARGGYQGRGYNGGFNGGYRQYGRNYYSNYRR